MKAVRSGKVWFSTDFHPFYNFATLLTYAERAPEEYYFGIRVRLQPRKSLAIKSLNHLSTIIFPFKATLIQAVTATSDIFFTLEELKNPVYSKCLVYIKTWGVNEYLKPFQ